MFIQGTNITECGNDDCDTDDHAYDHDEDYDDDDDGSDTSVPFMLSLKCAAHSEHNAKYKHETR